jgi:hypothetical protein
MSLRDLPTQIRGAAEESTSYYTDRESAARLAIHQRAAFKAAQRQQRIEAFNWYGYSRLRPPAAHLPIMGSATPWFGPVIYYQYPGVFFPRTATLAN